MRLKKLRRGGDYTSDLRVKAGFVRNPRANVFTSGRAPDLEQRLILSTVIFHLTAIFRLRSLL